jgi:hypothetical protein
VAAVYHLEEGNLGITSQIDVLCAIGNELHKSASGHLLYLLQRK